MNIDNFLTIVQVALSMTVLRNVNSSPTRDYDMLICSIRQGISLAEFESAFILLIQLMSRIRYLESLPKNRSLVKVGRISH